VFVPGSPFQPSLMFVGEAKDLPLSGAPERCFAQVGFLPYPQTLDWAGRLAREKHSTLLQKPVIYGRKKFNSTSPCGLYHTSLMIIIYNCNDSCQYNKTDYDHNLRS
jgi:hypothetical protein